ncbi:unnamed protein product [Pieris macdunnoughi]|uniref:Mitochondrial carrier protein n=1 Tax=Pieris macdunnoughi TaxID=345717 RepID=A0A821WR55_9NEOP|nr:unnamed protein product [Pieris macdunnoughi]
MSQRDTAIHLVAGGVAGTAGAVVTCPLEVVKTRLQSSKGVVVPPPPPPSSNTTSSKRVCSKIPKHQIHYHCSRFSNDDELIKINVINIKVISRRSTFGKGKQTQVKL